MSERADRPDPEELLRHGASVRAIATAILGDAAAADDVVQEAYLAALRADGPPPRNPAAWLRGVVRNLARRRRRGESRRRRREEVRAVRTPPAATATPGETAERLETESRLTEAVRGLPEPYRTVVVLRYFDGLSTAETAARTDAPEATVRTRLRRALAMLRSELDERYGARALWLPLLVRVARPDAPVGGAATAGATAALAAGGAAVMGKKILVAAAVLAVAVAGVVTLDRAGDLGDGPASVAERSTPETAPAPAATDPTKNGADAGATASAAAPAIRPEEAFRIVVRDPYGDPARGATLVLRPASGGDAANATTGEDGAALLRPTGEGSTLQVLARAAAPLALTVDALAGTEQVVGLPPGEEISGTLIVNGAAAVGREVKLDKLRAVTDSLGAFRFTGLQPGSSHWLTAGWDVWFVDPPGEGMRGVGIHVTAPAKDLVLEAGCAPIVTGRVFRADGSPISRLTVFIEWLDVEGQRGSTSRMPLRRKKPFEISLIGARRDLIDLKITLSDGEGGLIVLEPDPAGFRNSRLDLGDVTLPEARSIEFLVRGPDGAPVEGAFIEGCSQPSVTVEEVHPDEKSSATGKDGRTTIRLPDETREVLAGAPGFGVARVPVPAEPNGPVEVRLPGGTLLRIRVNRSDGSIPEAFAVRIDASERIFENSGGIYSRAGTSMPITATWQNDGGSESYVYAIPRSGVLVIAGIGSDRPLDLAAVDRLTGQVHERRHVVLGAREQKDVVFKVSVPERPLAVVVRDSAGKPVSGARVTVDCGEGYRHARTADDGRAQVEGVRGDEVRVHVDSEGFVPFTSDPMTTDRLPAELPVDLKRGRTVRLFLTNPNGMAVESEDVEATAPGLVDPIPGESEGAGEFLFRDLPDGPVRIAALYAGARFETSTEPGESVVRIQVPATGSALVRLEGRLDRATNHRIRLTPVVDGEGAPVVGHLGYSPTQESWRLRLPAVLPGRYLVALEHWVGRDEDGAIYETCRTGPVIEVKAGEETEARIPR